ncbi:conserved protein of unknown function [uncultured Sphingopyxis sp.]|uniref:Thioredoxin domain-containing protein n=1 Tax=uncultured Sphingopyxis sp. TaxID=310581 RepID=A0A1Y5PXS1_9SPHN|nr:TlpA family protein disulfide reductase [uncultured Sphingopyxis sp.]SBV32307.1 conserved protein of unknown function [uncultured Sphingopyxis sp.]
MTIVGRPAPPLRGVRWIDAAGRDSAALSLDDLGAGYRILYFFQHWCQGCHVHGFPTLVRLVAALAGTNAGFAAIQTVFEGHDVNIFESIRDDQQRYALAIPFGHAVPERGRPVPALMEDYRTGGTPWFVVIAPGGEVMFDGFQLDPEALVRAVMPPAA